MGVARMVHKAVPLDVTNGIELERIPYWVPAPAMGPDMVMICGEEARNETRNQMNQEKRQHGDLEGYELEPKGEGKYALEVTRGEGLIVSVTNALVT